MLLLLLVALESPPPQLPRIPFHASDKTLDKNVARRRRQRCPDASRRVITHDQTLAEADTGSGSKASGVGSSSGERDDVEGHRGRFQVWCRDERDAATGAAAVVRGQSE